jgi:hypothetical protein
LEREGRNLQTPVLLLDIPPVGYYEEATQRPGLDVPVGSRIHRLWVLTEIVRMAGAYQPKKYSGKVVIVQSEENAIGKASIGVIL